MRGKTVRKEQKPISCPLEFTDFTKCQTSRRQYCYSKNKHDKFEAVSQPTISLCCIYFYSIHLCISKFVSCTMAANFAGERNDCNVQDFYDKLLVNTSSARRKGWWRDKFPNEAIYNYIGWNCVRCTLGFSNKWIPRFYTWNFEKTHSCLPKFLFYQNVVLFSLKEIHIKF